MPSDDGSAQGAVWPLPKFCFSVDFGYGRPMLFTEVSGLESEVRPIEYRSGDSRDFSTIRMPGLRRFGNVTLKKGRVPNDSGFRDWFEQVKLNIIARRTVVISLLDENGAATMIWTLANAWPTKVMGVEARSDGDEIAIETVELAYESTTVSNA